MTIAGVAIMDGVLIITDGGITMDGTTTDGEGEGSRLEVRMIVDNLVLR